MTTSSSGPAPPVALWPVDFRKIPASRCYCLRQVPDYPEFETYPDDLKFGYDQTASAIDAPHNWSFQGNTTPLQTEPMPVASRSRRGRLQCHQRTGAPARYPRGL